MGKSLPKKSLDIIYDAQCRFCLRSLRLLEWLAGRRLFDLHNGNDSDLTQWKFPALAGADTNDAIFAVTPRREIFRGFFAFRRILWESPHLYLFSSCLFSTLQGQLWLVRASTPGLQEIGRISAARSTEPESAT